jgi:choline dehydrogenase
MASKRFDWGYDSDPEEELDGRRISCPRGKGLGGSSSINGMVYVRGNPQDYENGSLQVQRAGGIVIACPILRRQRLGLVAAMTIAAATGH